MYILYYSIHRTRRINIHVYTLLIMQMSFLEDNFFYTVLCLNAFCLWPPGRSCFVAFLAVACVACAFLCLVFVAFAACLKRKHINHQQE